MTGTSSGQIMNGAPKLSIGLPVYNGEKFLAQSLDCLLAQTFTDFEIIISDNASEDSTAEICAKYVAADSRIRYIRQPKNIGAGPNHNFVFAEARAPYFKWASHDDLYQPDLLLRCIELLDTHPDVVLVHSYEAFIDETGAVVTPIRYTLETDSQCVSRRFRSLLFEPVGDDFYGVIRSSTLKRTAMHGSFHHADRTITAEIGLYGRFLQVPGDPLLPPRSSRPSRASDEHNALALGKP